MSDKTRTFRCPVCSAVFPKATMEEPERSRGRTREPLKKNYKAQDPARRERAKLLRERNLSRTHRR